MPANAGTSIDCPACGKPMGFLVSLPPDHADELPIVVYECRDHGSWRLERDGVFRQAARVVDSSKG